MVISFSYVSGCVLAKSNTLCSELKVNTDQRSAGLALRPLTPKLVILRVHPEEGNCFVMSSVTPNVADVTYNSLKSFPPKATDVGFITGSLTFWMSSPVVPLTLKIFPVP